MKEKTEPGALEQVRAARHQISKKYNHDPKKLVEHYMELQQEYKDRLRSTEKSAEREKTA